MSPKASHRRCRRRSALVVCALMSLLLCPAVMGGENDEHVAKTRRLVSQMAAGQFDAAVEPFDQTMKRVLPAGKLDEVWNGVIEQFGTFEESAETRVEQVQQYTLVFVTCKFALGKLDAKVVFNPQGEIGGLFFVPSGKYQPPGYVDRRKFDEEEVTLGTGLLRLPGTLSIPKGEGPFPAIVLVHGSGPNDRDETIGPNKPFRDLAQGLASRGIAALRYEKRTKAHPILMSLSSGNVTVNEETVDDALVAVKLLRNHARIRPDGVFILGHSLGGMLIPRIAQGNEAIAGFISLAGSARPLEDLALDQTRYILSLDGELTEEDNARIEKLEAQVARVKSPDLSLSTPPEDFPLGVPASYWIDLRDYDPAKEIKAVQRPILVLHGERDYQVTTEDFERWRMALTGRDNARLISYPELNHLFIAGSGKSTPQEYSAPGNVAAVVIEDIAEWIAGNMRAALPESTEQSANRTE